MKKICALIACLIWTATTQSQPTLTAQDKQQISTEVLAHIQMYYEMFADENMDNLAEKVFYIPVTILHPGGIEAHTTGQAMIERSREHLEHLQESGWAYSEYHDPRVCVLNQSSAIASGNVIRKAKNGDTVSSGATTYLLTRTKQGWRIASFIGHAVQELLPCNNLSFAP